MPLTPNEISLLADECVPLLEGARVKDVHQPDEHTVVITFHAAGRSKLFLLFSTRPGLARFHLVPERPSSRTQPHPFREAARARLGGARLFRLRQVSGDRVVELAFTRRAAPGAPAASGGEVEPPVAYLIHEMMGARSQLVLLDGGRKVVAGLHPVRRGAREILPGAEYRFPEPRPRSSVVEGVAGNPWRYLIGSQADAFPAPFHLALGGHYARLEAEKVFSERRTALATGLRREAARLARLEEKVAADLAGAEKRGKDKEKGELLKGALGRLRRGMTSIELENFFEPGFPTVRIDLDPARTPVENVERIFHQARKARRALPFLRGRLAETREARARAEALLAQALLIQGEGAVDLAALEGIEEQVRERFPRTGRRRAAPARAPGAAGRKGAHPGARTPRGPARTFRSQDGIEILVGRSAKENDSLTLHVARGNDLFLHVAGSPGAHVIVRSAAGKTIPLETILDAAQLAIYYSLPERSRGAASAGMTAEVDYTPVKHVRKPRGAKPGLVLLATHKSVRVRLDPGRLDRLRRSSEPEGDGPN